ncbi:MAG: hypothetical protein GX821_12090, partial [Clostridiaceae bacterium]|nr:hypothetical protein [Clostridiaceae bacterium]
VLITISTGGLKAMAHDLDIPERYGIYATVGDTAGPGGWSRSIRNIPVFAGFAEDIRKLCPQAFIANYTNPMSTLTATLAHLTDNPVSGFCHAYFEIKDVIQKLFGLDDWSRIAVEIAGMNHRPDRRAAARSLRGNHGCRGRFWRPAGHGERRTRIPAGDHAPPGCQFALDRGGDAERRQKNRAAGTAQRPAVRPSQAA